MERIVEVCLTPAIYTEFHHEHAIVVVADILRATTAICSAFMNGASAIIPVATLEEALAYKEKGFMVAAERDGIVRDFADFGNSPYNFTPDRVAGKEIVYSTTNGTNCITMAASSHEVLIGSFLNLRALADYIAAQPHNLIILCAGWKNKFNLEDTLFAGALSQLVLNKPGFSSICDSLHASMDLWELARKNILVYIEKAAQRHRLKKNGLDDVLEYCFTIDKTDIIPFLNNEKLHVK